MCSIIIPSWASGVGQLVRMPDLKGAGEGVLRGGKGGRETWDICNRVNNKNFQKAGVGGARAKHRKEKQILNQKCGVPGFSEG